MIFFKGNLISISPNSETAHQKMNKKAEKANLEDLLFGWASAAAVPNLCEIWMNELIHCGIENLQTLEERAASFQWQRTLDQLSNGLVAKLEKWKKSKFFLILKVFNFLNLISGDIGNKEIVR